MFVGLGLRGVVVRRCWALGTACRGRGWGTDGEESSKLLFVWANGALLVVMSGYLDGRDDHVCKTAGKDAGQRRASEQFRGRM